MCRKDKKYKIRAVQNVDAKELSVIITLQSHNQQITTNFSDMEKLFLSHGVLWEVDYDRNNRPHISGHTYCPTPACRALLSESKGAYECVGCRKDFPCVKGYQQARSDVDRLFQGSIRSNWAVTSLDLPPTIAWDEDKNDEVHWIKARIGQKDGKKQAVIYIGEKVKTQGPQDYVQMFVDIDESQLRFDKGNQNPLRLLAKVHAEFFNAHIVVNKKDEEDALGIQ